MGGNRTTPSYVAFTDSERLIGDAAKNQVARNPEHTVFDAKRLIGRKFADPIVQADIKLWPFKVVSGSGDKPMIVVNFMGEEKKFHPEEVSSMILTKMKETAEAYLGTKVNDAVVTVPAYSTIRSARLPRTLVRFADLTCYASSTNRLRLRSHTVWTRKAVARGISSFTIWVVVRSTFPCS